MTNSIMIWRILIIFLFAEQKFLKIAETIKYIKQQIFLVPNFIANVRSKLILLDIDGVRNVVFAVSSKVTVPVAPSLSSVAY